MDADDLVFQKYKKNHRNISHSIVLVQIQEG